MGGTGQSQEGFGFESEHLKVRGSWVREGLMALPVSSSAANAHPCLIIPQSCRKQLNSCVTQQGILLTMNLAGEIVPSMCPQFLI